VFGIIADMRKNLEAPASPEGAVGAGEGGDAAGGDAAGAAEGTAEGTAEESGAGVDSASQ
jgi:hypothetical protein